MGKCSEPLPSPFRALLKAFSYNHLMLTREVHKVTPSDPAAVNSICSLHAPKYNPTVIGAYIHAFLTFGFQKGDFAEFLQLLARTNFGNGAKSRETNIRNGFSIVESLGIHCFRAFPWKKILAQKYQGGCCCPMVRWKNFFMEKRENCGFLGFRLCWIRFWYWFLVILPRCQNSP